MGFLVTFLIPGVVIGSVWLERVIGHPNLLVWAPWFLGYVIVPLVQMRWSRPSLSMPPSRAASPAWRRFYRILPLLTLPAQLAMLAVTTGAFVSGAYDGLGRTVLLLTTGTFSAMFAVNVAHELIHRRQAFDRFLGGVLLSTVSFGTFKVVHLQVHHPYVGTPLDFATARRGQTIYSFWMQSFAGNFGEAFRRERARARRSGGSLLMGELTLWTGLTLLWLAGVWYQWGGQGAMFFLAQSVIAIMYLDVINYLQHYGLTRQIGPGGRPEPVQDHHSWSSAMFLDDLLLLNLPRHANHHSQPQQPYQLLQDSDDAPRYPYSYGIMTMLLLVPALFRRVADPCLDRFEASRALGKIET